MTEPGISCDFHGFRNYIIICLINKIFPVGRKEIFAEIDVSRS
jgi:hypothetical protein